MVIQVMRIGIFGGTFDPIHLGHLILAEQAREQVELSEVWFVPAFLPPHKAHKTHNAQKNEQAVSRFEHRVEMLSLATAGHPAFRVEELEKERSGPSYTVETLSILTQRHPEAEFWLLVGADTLAELHTWREPIKLLSLTGLIVFPRPGFQLSVPEAHTAEELRGRVGLPEEIPLRLRAVQTPLLEIASRDLRQRVTLGQSIRYLVPRAVEVYLLEKRLYTRATPASAPVEP